MNEQQKTYITGNEGTTKNSEKQRDDIRIKKLSEHRPMVVKNI